MYNYTYVIEKDAEYGYIVHVMELPGVCNDGKTADEAINNVQDDISLALEALKDIGKSIPEKSVVVS